MVKTSNESAILLTKIEREIDELEKQVAQLKEELQKEENYTDYEKLSEIQNKIDELNGKIETLMIEWEDLRLFPLAVSKYPALFNNDTICSEYLIDIPVL